VSHAPVVVIDPNHEDPGLPAVYSTNREGSLAVMNYLTGLGHRRIAHIAGRMELVSANQRLQGYKDGLAAAGIPFDPDLVEIGDYMTAKAEKCALKLLALQDRPTAIFAANDMSALGVYRAAKTAGLCIPQDLSVVGFDNLREVEYMAPALTTVDQFLAKMGTIATEMMVKLISGEDMSSHSHILQTQLVIRASCQSPREGLAK
jgi:LacI family transcriptional regulator